MYTIYQGLVLFANVCTLLQKRICVCKTNIKDHTDDIDRNQMLFATGHFVTCTSRQGIEPKIRLLAFSDKRNGFFN